MSNNVFYLYCGLSGFGAAHRFRQGSSSLHLLRWQRRRFSDRHILTIAFPKTRFRRASGSAPVIVERFHQTMLLDLRRRCIGVSRSRPRHGSSLGGGD